MSNLPETIREEAARQGGITFKRFMELALYCPNSGYYERPDAALGRHGDFFTSVSVGSLFGEMLAFQFAEWLAELPPGQRQIVEAGAHDGRLALDILRGLQLRQPELAASVEYWILEPSPVRRGRQEETLKEFTGRVRWFESWGALPAAGVNGIIFSNELLDAMPVHRLGWDAEKIEWFEWGVTACGGAFARTKMPVSSELEVAAMVPILPRELLSVLPDGFTTEVCPAAVAWWRDAARALRAGKLMTIDYGLKAEEFFVPERKDGTARAYYRHHVSSDLLARPGEQDITAQVNFTAVQTAGETEGLRTETFQSQAQFLTGLLERILAAKELFGEWGGQQGRQFQTLTHPEHLGRPFLVLRQTR